MAEAIVTGGGYPDQSEEPPRVGLSAASPYHRRMSLRWDHEPVLHDPVVVAAFTGWNDAADAASDAVDWLAARYGATEFASIDEQVHVDFQAQRPHGHARRRRAPRPHVAGVLAARRGHPRRRARPRARVGTRAQLRLARLLRHR